MVNTTEIVWIRSFFDCLGLVTMFCSNVFPEGGAVGITASKMSTSDTTDSTTLRKNLSRKSSTI